MIERSGFSKLRSARSAFAVLFLFSAQAFCLDLSLAADLFRIPSAFFVSVGASSADLSTESVGVRLSLPRDYWIELVYDRALESTASVQTRTEGGSVSVGTDPLGEYRVELGGDVFGVEDQYRVSQVRLRGSAMPDAVFGVKNPGIDVSLELKASRFSFVNRPNPVFTAETVELDAVSARFDLSYYFLKSWSAFVFTERTKLDQRFQELNRPLAPVFIPETAVSTGLSWPGDESGFGLSFSRRRFGLRVSGARRVAAVSGDVADTFSSRFHQKWSRRIETAFRYGHSRSSTDASLSPIDFYGLELSYLFESSWN